MDKKVFLDKLLRAWEIRGGTFGDFMGDAIYLTENHTEIVYSKAKRLEVLFERIIAQDDRCLVFNSNDRPIIFDEDGNPIGEE